MERKDSDLDSDGDFGEKEIYGEGSDGEDDSCGEKAPRSDAVAIREGYNQTYIVKSSDNNLHQVLFRCGNWCYTGNVDLGSSVIGLSEIVSAIPALQKQQGSLQFMCEWKKMPVNSIYTRPLNILYDTFDFIGDELVSEHITAALEKAATTFDWVDAEDAKNYFELQTEGLDCFKVCTAFSLTRSFFYTICRMWISSQVKPLSGNLFYSSFIINEAFMSCSKKAKAINRFWTSAFLICRNIYRECNCKRTLVMIRIKNFCCGKRSNDQVRNPSRSPSRSRRKTSVGSDTRKRF